MAKRLLFLLLGVLVIGLMMTSVALAATPQDIYNDYAADHVLNGTYTNAELQAYLDDAIARQYFNVDDLTALDAIAMAKLNEGRETFPFTGAQLVLMSLVVVALVGGGVALAFAEQGKHLDLEPEGLQGEDLVEDEGLADLGET